MTTSQVLEKISDPTKGVIFSKLQRHQETEAEILLGLELIHDVRYAQIEEIGDVKLESLYQENELLLLAQYWLSAPFADETRANLQVTLTEEFGFPDSEFTYYQSTPVERAARGAAFACAEIERLKRIL